MTIDIVRPTTPTLRAPLDEHGEIEVYEHAELGLDSGRLDEAIAMRWVHAPRGARMSQLLSARAFLWGTNARSVPLPPAPPHTDVTTRRRDVSFPLSPPDPRLRVWSVDALPGGRRRDPGRAYVTDESYSFSERHGSTIVFYDKPALGLRSVTGAMAAHDLPASELRTLELTVLFHTELWVGAARLGAVHWSCSFRYPTSYFGSLTTGQEHPDYEPASFHRGLMPDGPTRAESRALLFRWQRFERAR